MINSGIFLMDVNRTFVHSWKTFIKRKYKNRNAIVQSPRDGSDQECWGDYFGKDIYQLPLNYNANYDSVKDQRIDKGNIHIATTIRQTLGGSGDETSLSCHRPVTGRTFAA